MQHDHREPLLHHHGIVATIAIQIADRLAGGTDSRRKASGIAVNRILKPIGSLQQISDSVLARMRYQQIVVTVIVQVAHVKGRGRMV